MIATLAICTVLYVAVTAGADRDGELEGPGRRATRWPKALQAARAPGAGGDPLLRRGDRDDRVLLVFQLGQPRIFMVDGARRAPARLGAKVHPRFRTPYVTTILTGLVVGVPAMFVDINEAVEFTNIGTLFAFVLVSVGVIVLRRTRPGRHRPFRCPGVPVRAAALGRRRAWC